MPILPTGTITFLFSDIEGSTKKWERQPEAMRVALAEHDRLLREVFEACGGYVFKTIGDAFCVAFDTAREALEGAVQAQRALLAASWEGIEEIKVRMALHTGAAEQRDNDYFGQPLNRVARILASAHGGQVLLSLPTQELVRDGLPEGVQLRVLGEHRLRDLARPEQLFQVIATGLPSQFPALRSLEKVPNNLPVQLTSFIGREREVEEVKRLLGSTRLLTLTGMGGTGKTRLSLQVAADVLDQFSDGVWLVEFATITDPDWVIETVAAAFDLRQEAGRPLAATLTSFLRNQQLLLILDNCEHVVAACARLAEALLRSCPGLRILASSREPLGIAGETAWPLPPLTLPGHWREIVAGPHALERLAGYEAVRLFADRAAVVRPSFQLSNDNVHLIAQICWRLDGIALAIELAAARVRVLTLPQIVERLDDRFRLLTTGARTAVPRQQTLRSLIDWSHDLLAEPERRLFRRLAVFARGRTLEAIEAVCSDDGVPAGEIVDLLSQLVDKSLVFTERTSADEERYFLLESIWDYADEKLVEAGEKDAFRIRHLDHYLAFAEEASKHLDGPRQKEWLGRVDLEEGNVRAAVDTSLELPGQASKGLRIVAAAHRYVEVRGLFKDARENADQLLAHPENATRDRLRASALAAAGRLAWIADDLPRMEAVRLEALGIYRALNDPRGIAQALIDLASHALETPDPAKAQALLEEGMSWAAKADDPRLTASGQHTQATLAAATGDFARAMALAEESLAFYRQAGDAWMSIITSWSVAVNAIALGDFAKARARLTESLKGGLSLGNRWAASYPFDAFGMLAVAERQYERAARLMGASEAQRLRIGLVPAAADHPALGAVMAAAMDFTGPAIEAAHREGRKLTFEATVALALGSDEDAPSAEDPAHRPE